MRSFLQDLRYGIRMMAKRPGFTLVAALTLALGIGANTAIFSAVKAVLLKPLQFPESGQLVDLSETFKPDGYGSVSVPTFADWKSQNTVFTGIAAYSSFAAISLLLAGARVRGAAGVPCSGTTRDARGSDRRAAPPVNVTVQKVVHAKRDRTASSISATCFAQSSVLRCPSLCRNTRESRAEHKFNMSGSSGENSMSFQAEVVK
jgi:hypothetical protein